MAPSTRARQLVDLHTISESNIKQILSSLKRINEHLQNTTNSYNVEDVEALATRFNNYATELVQSTVVLLEAIRHRKAQSRSNVPPKPKPQPKPGQQKPDLPSPQSSPSPDPSPSPDLSPIPEPASSPKPSPSPEPSSSPKPSSQSTSQAASPLATFQDSDLGFYRGNIKFGLGQLGGKIVPTIHEVLNDFKDCKKLGYFKATIDTEVMSSISAKRIGERAHDTSGAAVTKSLHLRPVKGFEGNLCTYSLGEDSTLDFSIPDLSENNVPGDSHQFICSTISTRKAETLRYLVIPADSSPCWRTAVGLPETSFLDCGERLRMTRSEVSGIHTTYEYISADSGTPTGMHIEDGYLGSINIVLAGAPKIWLFIPPLHRQSFESLVNDLFKKQTKDCSQFVRHLNLVISPRLLEEHGIGHHIVSCAAGEMIVTLPGTYHEVINAGPNYAEAINFAVGLDWTGVPDDYRFCKGACGGSSITREQLCLPDQSIEPIPDTPGSIGSCSDSVPFTDIPSQDPAHDEPDPSSGLNTDGRLTPGPYTPHDYDDGENGQNDGNADRTPHKPTNESVTGLQNDSTQQYPTPPESIRKFDRGTTQPHATPTIPIRSQPQESQNKGSRDVISISDSDTEESLTVDLSLDDTPRPQSIVGTAGKIEHLIGEVAQFASAFGVSSESFEHFKPTEWLNDELIMATLQLLLPEECEPRIAFQSIRNFPRFGLATRLDQGSQPKPYLHHKEQSKYLFIAYNVSHGSLHCHEHGSGNHWTLVIVDIEDSRVHVFGAETGLEEQATVLAQNVGDSVNECRKLGHYLPCINWQKPNLQPLYEKGVPSDTHNCGIAVISRAEAFMNPTKALTLTDSTPLEKRREVLNDLRLTYLEAFQKRINRVRSDEFLKGGMGLSLTTGSSASTGYGLLVQNKKRQNSSGGEERPRKLVKAPKASFCIRDASTRKPKPKAMILQVSSEWHNWIRTCAEAKGFNGELFVETVKHAPKDQPLSMVLRVLQLMCDVANEDLLFKLRRVLLAGKTAVTTPDSIEPSYHTLAAHFSRVQDHAIHPHYSQFFAWLAQMFYYEEFQQVCNDASAKLNKAKRERDHNKKAQGTNRALKFSANAALGALSKHEGHAETRVKRAVSEILGGDQWLKPLEKYISQGETLHELLSFDGESRGSPFWLYLMPLYEGSQRIDPLTLTPPPPVLELARNEAPEVFDKLRKPITCDDFFDLNQSLTKFFAQYLFTARPELRHIDLRGVERSCNSGHATALESLDNDEITRRVPEDIASLFGPAMPQIEP